MLVVFCPAAVLAQGVTPRTTDLIATSIKVQQGKLDKNTKLIELHELCIDCDSCTCKVFKKNGSKQHQHVAKAKFGRKVLKVKHEAAGKARMESKVNAAIKKIREENEAIEEEMAKLTHRLEALGGSTD